jgi:hypothetical protein
LSAFRLPLIVEGEVSGKLPITQMEFAGSDAAWPEHKELH